MASLFKAGGSAGNLASIEILDTGALVVTDATGATILSLSAAGALAAASTIAATGAATVPDLTVASATPLITLDDTGSGSTMVLTCYDSGVVTLDTGDAVTALTLGIPAAAFVIGRAAKVVAAVTGTDSTTGTFTLTGGSTSSVGTISTFTAGHKSTVAIQSVISTTAATDATFTLSGGSDNTPTAGSVRLVVWALVLTDID